MRPVVPIVFVALLTAACAGERPILLDGTGDGLASAPTDSAAAPTSAAESTPATIPIVPPSTSTPAMVASVIEGEVTAPRGGIRALISPTGVVMPVVGQADNGYVATTPCGNETLVPWGQPLRRTQVVLDPGHGGDESGAVGANGLSEAVLNLRVAKQVAALLSDREVSVVLTRNADYRIPVAQRAALANALDAEAFVSIHHNTPAAVASDGPGTEVYVQASQPESGRLGALIYENVTARLDRFDVEWVARSDAGVLVVLNDADEDAFGINRRSAVPAALVELAYIGNPEEAVLMASDEYVTTAAQAVALGIEQFLTTDEPGTGYVAASRRFNPSGETGGDSGCTDPPLG